MSPKTAVPDQAKAVDLVRVAVRIRGVTPLYMDAVSLEEQERIRRKQRAPKTEELRTPREEASGRLHVLADGRPHITPYLWPALVNAGRFVRFDGRRQISTTTESALGGLCSIEEAAVVLVAPNGVPLSWEAELRTPRTDSGLVAKVLPRFDAWAAEFTLRINGQWVSPTKIRELVDVAGGFIGLGPLRPQKRGYFGRFSVDKWLELA